MKIDLKKLRTHAEAIMAMCDGAEAGDEENAAEDAAPEEEDDSYETSSKMMKMKLAKYK